jgi:hypothetical protein
VNPFPHNQHYRKLGVDSEMKEFKLMPHGFLSFNFPMFGMREESSEGIRVSGEWLRELLEDSKKKEETQLEP